MIPSIEQIVSGLLAGVHTKDQAIDWLEQHVSGATNELRDYFASKALPAILSDTYFSHSAGYKGYSEFADEAAESAFVMADAMLEARKTKSRGAL